MKNTIFNKKNIVVCLSLIATAVIWRLINHQYQLAPNLEIVTTATVLAAIIIGTRAAVTVPLAAIIISDLFIGNSSIFIFTWGSFALIGLFAILLRRFNDNATKQIVGSLGFAISSSFIFFIITNLGVWLQGWYPMTFAGLSTCFTLAIPFYRTMLIGNLIIVPVSVLAYHLIKFRQKARLLVINTLSR